MKHSVRNVSGASKRQSTATVNSPQRPRTRKKEVMSVNYTLVLKLLSEKSFGDTVAVKTSYNATRFQERC